MHVTERIAASVRADYGSSAVEVLRWLSALDVDPAPGERVAGAILARGRGNWREARRAVELAAVDWRDVLMGTGLEHANWQQVLDERFGHAVSNDPTPGDLDKLAMAASALTFDPSSLPRVADHLMPDASAEYRERVVADVRSAVSAFDVHINVTLLGFYDTSAAKKGSALHQWAEDRYPWMSLHTRATLITRGLWHLK